MLTIVLYIRGYSPRCFSSDSLCNQFSLPNSAYSRRCFSYVYFHKQLMCLLKVLRGPCNFIWLSYMDGGNLAQICCTWPRSRYIFKLNPLSSYMSHVTCNVSTCLHVNCSRGLRRLWPCGPGGFWSRSRRASAVRVRGRNRMPNGAILEPEPPGSRRKSSHKGLFAKRINLEPEVSGTKWMKTQ